jgi:FkbM family methyltransferase
MNTRLVFKILLRRFRVDCVFDIGSCDGDDALLFRQILPKAAVVAFEANPINYRKMAENPNLKANRIEVFPCAITNATGTARFNVADVNYDNPTENRGLSSLLVAAEGPWQGYQDVKVKEIVEVETCRLDEFVRSRHPDIQSIGLWIDVEGAEFGVLEGMAGIKDRVVAIHVETARVALRVGQKPYAELELLMKSLGFVPMGTNMSEASLWGDVVFVNQKAFARLGLRFHFCQWASALSHSCRVDSLGPFLRKHCRPLYTLLGRVYFKLFT